MMMLLSRSSGIYSLLCFLLFLSGVSASKLYADYGNLAKYQHGSASWVQALIHMQETSVKYEQNAIDLISSLRIPESCLFSSLTKDLVQKCQTAPQAIDGPEKVRFATSLAICEFKVAGVQYPRECRGHFENDSDIRNCVKKIEGKPQWWTTWSNCLQNIGVICQTVRQEADRDTLLNLYSNITTLNTRLHDYLSSTLGQVNMYMNEQEDAYITFQSHHEGFWRDISEKRASILRDLESAGLLAGEKLARTQEATNTMMASLMTMTETMTGRLQSHLQLLIELKGILKAFHGSFYTILSDISKSGKDLSQQQDIAAKKMESSLVNIIHESQHQMGIATTSFINNLKNVSIGTEAIQNHLTDSQFILSEMSKDYLDLRYVQSELVRDLANQEQMQKSNLKHLTELSFMINNTMDSFTTKTDLIIARLERMEQLGSACSFGLKWVICGTAVIGLSIMDRRYAGIVMILIGLVLYLHEICIRIFKQDATSELSKYGIDGRQDNVLSFVWYTLHQRLGY